MTVLITDPYLERQLIEDRQQSGGDRFDEVWEGVYSMPPLPNDEHQEIQANLVSAIKDALGWESSAKIRAGVNLSDRDRDWNENYRCPDVVVFLPGNPAVNRGAHWQGGPDFLVEIASEGDRALEKLAFYGKLGVREALVVQREPWSLELYRPGGASGVMTLTAKSTPADGAELPSIVLPLTFRLIGGASRPLIEAVSTQADASAARRRWLI